MPRILIVLTSLALLTGCEREEPEAESTREFVQIQADQNRRLVELQNKVQVQHGELQRQRDALEVDRKELAVQRRRDPVIAEAILAVGTLLACLSPILLAWVLLRRGGTEPDAELIAETLIRDVSSGQSSLLIPALTHARQPDVPRLAADSSYSSSSQEPS